MADNVTTQSTTLATIPASTKISTDEDATNGHVQRVKLAVSTDGASTHIGGDANGLQVQGAVAHDAVDTGNPLKVGFKAKNFDGTEPGTPVAEGDVADGIGDVYGRQFVETAHPNRWVVTANYAAAQTDTSLKTAPGASLRLYITDIMFSCDGAINITLQDEDNTTVLPTVYLGARGGVALNFVTPVPITANKALELDSTQAVNHSVLIMGYTAP